jgi:hypothetical protein
MGRDRQPDPACSDTAFRRDGACSTAGVLNATAISVTERNARCRSFFNKTIRNVRENPRAHVTVHDIHGKSLWMLELEFERSETEGPVFDAMDMQIEAIASMTGMTGIFKLRAADIYRVISVERQFYPSHV